MARKIDIKSRIIYVVGVAVVKETTGNQVRRLRRAADLTQADLAKAVEVSRQTVVSIEGGDYAPSVYLALRIAEVLNTTVEALFGSTEN